MIHAAAGIRFDFSTDYLRSTPAIDFAVREEMAAL
jgi:hypothetical protein